MIPSIFSCACCHHLLKCLFRSCAHKILGGYLSFLLLSYKSFLYILDINFMSLGKILTAITITIIINNIIICWGWSLGSVCSEDVRFSLLSCFIWALTLGCGEVLSSTSFPEFSICFAFYFLLHEWEDIKIHLP